VKTSTLTAVLTFACISLLLVSGGCSSFAGQKNAEVKRITGEEMKILLDDPDTTVIDVRLERDWEQSDQKIKGAVHENPMAEEASWAGTYPKDKHIILY
jgi:hypothetical protein